MKLKTRLKSVASLAGGLGVGLTAWGLVLGFPSPQSQVPNQKMDQPAAATVSISPSTEVTSTPSIFPSSTPQRFARVPVPQSEPTTIDIIVPSDTPGPTTSSPEPTLDVQPTDTVQGPQFPPVIPPSPSPTPTREPTQAPTTGVPIQ